MNVSKAEAPLFFFLAILMVPGDIRHSIPAQIPVSQCLGSCNGGSYIASISDLAGIALHHYQYVGSRKSLEFRFISLSISFTPFALISILKSLPGKAHKSLISGLR